MSVRELERVGHRTWRALEEEWYDGWLLRYSQGVTRRANSVSPVEPSTLSLERKIVECESRYRDHGLPAIFRLCLAGDPGLDELLARRGYQRRSGADIMTLRIQGPERDQSVEIESAPSDVWLEALADEKSRFANSRPVIERMVRSAPEPAAFAAARQRGSPAAVGMGVVDAGYVAIFNMRTRDFARRAGLARRILTALLAWGSEHGADTAFLQVEPDNEPAQKLYRSFGFEKQYEYWYRQRP